MERKTQTMISTNYEIYASNADYGVLVLTAGEKKTLCVYNALRTEEMAEDFLKLWRGEETVVDAIANWETSEGDPDEIRETCELIADQNGIHRPDSSSCNTRNCVSILAAAGVPVIH